MHEPFVDKIAFLSPQPNVDSTYPGRYQSDLSKIQGVTAELYEVLPKDMHDKLQSSTNFQSLVSENGFSYDSDTNILSKFLRQMCGG